MQLLDHYLLLYNRLTGAETGKNLNVTLEEISRTLCCSNRNARKILKKMAELNWVRWAPGRGRGHHSSLTLTASFEDLLLKIVGELIAQEDLKRAAALINRYATDSSFKERFTSWLYSHFLHSTEIQGQKRIDILRIPFDRLILTLDPAYVMSAQEFYLIGHIFDSLVKYNPTAQCVEPHLAHHWEVDEMGTTWTFYLRKGVRFHHGREMTADDVLYSVTRTKNLSVKSLYRWMYSKIRQMAAIDETTIQIQLEEPNHFFPNLLSTQKVIPRDIYEAAGEKVRMYPVGTGPFKVMRHDETMCALEANDNYFQGRPFLDRVEIWIVPDFLSKQDVFDNKQFQLIVNSRSQGGSSQILQQLEPSNAVSKMLFYNLNKDGPQQNIEFRKAICYGIDKGRIAKEAGEDSAYPATSFLPRKSLETDGQESKPDESLRILAENDFQKEKLILCTHENLAEEAKKLQEHLADLGIKTDLSVLTMEEFLYSNRTRKAHLIFSGYKMGEHTELTLLNVYLEMLKYLPLSTASVIEQMVSQLVKEPSQNLRMEKLMKIEDFLKKHFAVLFLYHQQSHSFYHSFVRGVTLNELGWVNLKDVWFAKTNPPLFGDT